MTTVDDFECFMRSFAGESFQKIKIIRLLLFSRMTALRKSESGQILAKLRSRSSGVVDLPLDHPKQLPPEFDNHS